jgi:hypothetical protein
VVVSNSDGTNAEVMLCTTRATDALTCSRAANATGESPVPTKLSHASGSIISCSITAGAMNQIRQDHIRSFSGALPTDGRAGDLAFATDDVVAWRNNGSSFVPFGPVWPLTAPIPGNFAWVNQGGASMSSRNGSMLLTGTNQTSDSLRYFGLGVPATPYSYVVGFTPYIIGEDFQHMGFGFTDGTKFEHICVEDSGNIAVQKFNTSTSFNSRPVERSFRGNWGMPLLFFKVRNDGVNITFSAGPSPFDFVQLFQEATGAFLSTITKAGFVLDGNFTGVGAANLMLIYHFAQGS